MFLKCRLLVLLACLLPGILIGFDSTHLQQQIPTSIRLDKPSGVVTLRGMGIYKRFTQDVYAGAFYSQDNVLTPKEALNDPKPKRMLFIFLMPLDNFDTLIAEGLRLNNSPEVLLADQIHMSQFLKILTRSFNAGDMVMFDYIPMVGTRITINSAVEGVISGEAFYQYLLKIWMGRQPPSLKFQHDLFVRNAVLQ